MLATHASSSLQERKQRLLKAFNMDSLTLNMEAEAPQEAPTARPSSWDADCIIPGYLWVGSLRAAHDLQGLRTSGVRRVLSLCTPEMFGRKQLDGVEYSDFDLRDDPDQDLTSAFKAMNDLVCLGRGTNALLVHCMAGQSRSATLAIGFLVTKLGLCLEHASSWVCQRRPVAMPNFGFWTQLSTLAREDTTMRLDALCPDNGADTLRGLADMAALGGHPGCCAFCAPGTESSPTTTPTSSSFGLWESPSSKRSPSTSTPTHSSAGLWESDWWNQPPPATSSDHPRSKLKISIPEPRLTGGAVSLKVSETPQTVLADQIFKTSEFTSS